MKENNLSVKTGNLGTWVPMTVLQQTSHVSYAPRFLIFNIGIMDTERVNVYKILLLPFSSKL